MPDKPSHQLFFQWGAVRIGAVGIPAVLVVLAALIVFAHLGGAW